jgi:hypothetical protein
MHIPIEEIAEIDRLNMTDFIEALGGSFDPDRRREKVKEEIEKGAIFILVNSANHLVGYIEYWIEKNRTLNVASIQVIPKFRNGTVLRKLLSQAYYMIEKDPPSEAITSVQINNRLSEKLNHKLGFKKIKEEGDRIIFKASGVELLNSLAYFANKGR